MSDVKELVIFLHEKGITVYLHNNKLKTKSVPGAITADIAEMIRSNKSELIKLLQEYEAGKIEQIPKIQKVADRENIPLSFAQQRLWFIDQLEGGSPQYNMPMSLRLEGLFDIKVAEQAIIAIIQRHEILRTVFREKEGIAIQIIKDRFDFRISCYDLSGLKEKERCQEIVQLSNKDRSKIFNLNTDLMVRASYLCLSDTKQHYSQGILLFNMHHIASDGWSLSVLVKEFVKYYQAFFNGKTDPMPALAIQYADYCYWQREWLQGDVLERQLEYWRNQLQECPSLHGLVLDYPRPAVKKHDGAILRASFSSGLCQQLQTVAHEKNVTLFMLLHAVLGLMLSRHSNSHDILLGTPVANRKQTELESLIGFFVNTLVLRTNTHYEYFNDYLAHVRQVNLDAQAHQDIPFEQLLEYCSVVRSTQHTPLFQILFNMNTTETNRLSLPDLTVSSLSSEQVIGKFDLEIVASASDDGLYFSWIYDTSIFNEQHIQLFNRHLGYLLEDIVKMPQARMVDLSMLSRQEVHYLLYELNATLTDYPREQLIHELFETQVELFPDNIALIYEDKQLTYRELNKSANRLAHYLCEQGVGVETLVGICVERSLEMVIGLLGILKAGGAYVPLDPAYPDARLQFVLEDTGLRYLLIQDRFVDKFLLENPLHMTVLNDQYYEELIADYSETNTEKIPGRNANNLVYVIYTSGSTGQPKGVMVEHQALVNRIDWMQKAYNLNINDRVLQKTPYSFDVSVWEFFWTLGYGAGLVMAKPDGHKDPVYLSELLEQWDISILHFVPSMLHLYLNTAEAVFHQTVRYVFCSGEALDLQDAKTLQGRASHIGLYNLYGPTEAAIDVSYFDCGQLTEQSSVPIGRPIQNIRLYVLQEDLQLCPSGVAGELYIGGEGLARGYLSRAELTREKFIRNPFSDYEEALLYKTGDRVRYLADGNLEYLGRLDNQIKLRGFRIELGEIEHQLIQLHYVREALVCAINNTQGDTELLAYVILHKQKGDTDDEKTLLDWRAVLAEKLPEYMLPTALIILDEWPLTVNGKVNYQALPKAEAGIRAKFEALITEQEELLAKIWAKVLDMDWQAIGRSDNFFSLGGHSLLIIQYRKYLNDKGYDLPVATLYQSQTLAELAESLRQYNINHIPPVGIPLECDKLRPDMLPMVELDLQQLLSIERQVKGGSSNIKDIYPVSALQYGMLFHSLTTPGFDPYVIKTYFKCDSIESYQNFLEALNFVIVRHDALRTQVVHEGLIEPVQLVCRQVELPIHRIELDHPPEDINLWLKTHQLPPEERLCLGQAPQIRLHVLEHDDAFYVLLFNHHFIEDNLSLRIIISEIQSYLLKATDSLSPPPQYRAFVWQGLQTDSAKAESYFKNYLQGFHNICAPFGIIGKPESHTEMVIHRQDLATDLSEKVRKLAVGKGVSLSAVLHLAWAVVISKTSGQSDVIFGSVLSGRTQAIKNIEQMVGLCINTLPIRMQCSGVSINDSLIRVQEALGYLVKYEQASLPSVQAYSEIPSGTPLFASILNCRFQQNNTKTIASEQFGIHPLLTEEHTNYPLTTSVDFINDDIRVTVEAPQSIGAQRILCYFIHTLNSLINQAEENIETDIVNVSIIPDAEIYHLVYELNKTEKQYGKHKCIDKLFEEQVAKTPDNVAVAFDTEQLTYRELNTQANQLAHYLQYKGVRLETLVGLCMERGLNLVVAILGILKAGGAYVPLDPNNSKSRMEKIINDGGIRFLLGQADLFNDMQVNDYQFIRMDTLDFQSALKEHSDNNLHFSGEQNLTRLAYMIYTSGSTGAPKGTMITHNSVVNLLSWYVEEYKIQYSDKVLVVSSSGFDLTQKNLLAPLIVGASVHFATAGAYEPDKIQQYIARQQITLMNCAPSAFYPLLDDQLNYEHLSSLRCVLLGGEKIDYYRFQPWLADDSTQTELVNMYGPTECTDIACSYRVPDSLALSASSEQIINLPIGRPNANVQLYVLDDCQQLLPKGVIGELYIGGAGVSRGYINQLDLTRERFIENPFADNSADLIYRTGDLVRYLADDNLEFIGRQDDQVKLRGFRMELGEIKYQLLAMDEVNACVVLVREDDPGHKTLAAYVVLDGAIDEDCYDTANRLRENLRAYLPDYMIPSAIVVIEAIPLTLNGKIDKKALPVPDGSLAQGEYVAPETEMEKRLVGIWAELLKLDVDTISVTTSFFDLGGHSLLATRLINRVRQELVLELPLQLLFEHPCIADFVKAMSAIDEVSIMPTIPVLQNRHQLPLSFAQQRLWFIDRMEGGSPQYNIPGMFRLLGRLNQQAFYQAMDTIFQRHEVLRTHFKEENNKVYQYISPTENLPLIQVDLSAMDVEQKESHFHGLLKENAGYCFDLQKEMPFRVYLIILAAEEYVMLFNIHHIASDGWSMGVLTEEFCTLYDAYSLGEKNPLAPLSVQYADYAHWQRQWLQGRVLEKQLAYWQKQLAGIPAVHSLPLDNPRPAQQSFRGGRHSQVLDTSMTENIYTFCQQQDVTLFMFLQTAFAVLFSRFSNETDIVIGTPIAGRTHQELEPLIGFFVNSLVLRSKLDGNPVVHSLLFENKQHILDAYTHQHIPFEMLVDELNPQRSLSYSPIFQIMLTLQNNEQQDLVLSDLKFKPIKQEDNVAAKFDLNITITEQQGHIYINWAYNVDLFAVTSIHQYMNCFATLLQSIIASPQEPVQSLALLTVAEQQQLLIDWNATKTNFPADLCLHEIFEKQVLQTPLNTALVYEKQQLSYQGLNAQSNQLAFYLSEQGVSKGNRVVLSMERSLDMIIGLLAILKLGGIYIPVDTDQPTSRLKEIIDDVSPSAILTNRDTDKKLVLLYEEIGEFFHIYFIENGRKQAYSKANPSIPVSSSEPAYIVYTSGSTGIPKGIIARHESVINYLEFIRKEYQMAEEDRCLQLATISFDASVREIFASLGCGASLYLLASESAKNPAQVGELLKKHGVTRVLSIVPSYLRALCQALATFLATPLNNIKTVLVSGEVLLGQDCDMVRQAFGHDVELVNQYGPTEATITSTYYRVGMDDHWERSPIGKPIQNVTLYVLDSLQQIVPVGVIGELYIKGVGVSQGYWQRESLTDKAFISALYNYPEDDQALWYRTGDYVRYRHDGNLEFIGRKDNQLKIRGIRIELGEVEAQLLKQTSIKQCAVLAITKMLTEKQLVAYIVVSEQYAEQSTETRESFLSSLRSSLQLVLPVYMVPTQFIVMDKLPLTSSNKIDRKALPVPGINETDQSVYVKPRNNMEKILCGIWQEILGLEQVGIYDNFFSLGGHSLSLMRVYSRIRDLGINITVKNLFEFQTISDLAENTQKYQSVVETVQSQEWIDELSLVKMNEFSGKNAIFCIHPLGGTVSSYAALADGLKDYGRFYGLQAPYLYIDEPMISVESLAAYYIKLIKKVQANGPYCLLGWSLGGKLAYEVAYQLSEKGEDIAYLGLFDASTNVAEKQHGEWFSCIEALHADDIRFEWSQLKNQSPDMGIEMIIQQAIRQNVQLEELSQGLIKRYLYYLYHLNHCLGKYSSPRSNICLDLFKARKRDNEKYVDDISLKRDYGWSEISSGEVTILDTGGFHENMIKTPFVDVLLDKLRPRLILHMQQDYVESISVS